MRMFCMLMLLMFVAVIGVFILQNQESITLHFFGESVTSPLSLLLAIVYLLGMVSGWTVVALVQRSLRRATSRPSH